MEMSDKDVNTDNVLTYYEKFKLQKIKFYDTGFDHLEASGFRFQTIWFKKWKNEEKMYCAHSDTHTHISICMCKNTFTFNTSTHMHTFKALCVCEFVLYKYQGILKGEVSL